MEHGYRDLTGARLTTEADEMGWSEEFRYRDCPWCGARDTQMPTMSGAHNAPRADGSTRTYMVLRCPRCAGPVIIETTATNNGDHRILTVIPESLDDAAVAHLPDDVSTYMRDAVVVLRAGVPDAAAVQLRRALEAAAAQFGVEEKTLVGSIEKLIDDGLITSEFSKVLHHVRKVGNLGAHAADERVSQEEAERALRFTVQVLRNLFEIPAELAALEAEAPGH